MKVLPGQTGLKNKKQKFKSKQLIFNYFNLTE